MQRSCLKAVLSTAKPNRAEHKNKNRTGKNYIKQPISPPPLHLNIIHTFLNCHRISKGHLPFPNTIYYVYISKHITPYITINHHLAETYIHIFIIYNKHISEYQAKKTVLNNFTKTSIIRTNILTPHLSICT